MGIARDGPTKLYTDSLSNQRVSTNSGSSSHSRHLLIRYEGLKRRAEAGIIDVYYVPDPQNPSDFLTKWVPANKLETSLKYAHGPTAASGPETPEPNK